jgi:hypothetical protein
VLWEFHDETMSASWPSQATIAARLDMSERHVRRLIHELEQAGWLRVERSAPTRDPVTGRWCRRRTNRYRWAWERVAARSVRAARENSQLAPRGHRMSSRSCKYLSGRPEWGGGRNEIERESFARLERLNRDCPQCAGTTWIYETDTSNTVRPCPQCRPQP